MIVAITILVIGIVWAKGFWFTEVFHTHESNKPRRIALLQIRNAISVGASHTEVLAAYWEHRTDQLRLSADSPTEWLITIPLEFGARDWKLVIEFRNGQVSAVRIRTSDGLSPKQGPKDKQIDAG